MTPLILFCVFGITRQSAGVLKSHDLSWLERARLKYRIASIDQSRENAVGLEIFRKRQFALETCQARFGAKPDLVWYRGSR